MTHLRQALNGFVAAILSSAIVLGSLSLTIAEGNSRPSTPVPQATATETLLPPQPGSTSIFTAQPSPTFTMTATIQPPASCPPPQGWVAYTIQSGDTLGALAQIFKVTPDQLSKANCLFSDNLLPGAILYVPDSTPTATQPPVYSPTAIPCGPPPGWIVYTVQPNDNLFRLSQAFGVNVYTLQRANCMGNSTLLLAGSRIYVPNVPTRTPTATKTNTPAPAPRPTQTPTRPQPTSTYTSTPSATSSPTQTTLPTETATSTSTPIPATEVPPTSTALPTDIPTVAPTAN
ncbi:MAG: LysM peptidoglycan-binding domain-containing protein [Chloroflexi bacterium]|nr:LysM peptidoglycan-binding domain-containing protein [Chloroflexota bacterium]